MLDDDRFINKAILASSHSPDRNRKVGTVIVDKTGCIRGDGCNDYPDRTISGPGRDKYKFMIHAEIAAIAEAARMGWAVHGCTMYTTYFPCATCAGAIINAGIFRVVAPLPDLNHHRWGQSWKTAIAMLKEAGVTVSYRKIDG